MIAKRPVIAFAPLRLSRHEFYEFPDVVLAIFPETHSTLIYRWAENAGLNVIACISPRYIADKSGTYSWEPTNLAQLLSFNDRMGHTASWQLGYGKAVGELCVRLGTTE